MTLYLVKNGQKLGPYSLAEAQALVAAGTVKANDWTWYEGLPNWIPLNQVPGFVAPLGPGQRPVLVWFICIYTFLSTAYFLISWISILSITETDLTTNPPTHHHMISSIGYFQMIFILLKLGLNLTWALLFFLLKRNSLYVFIGTLALGLALLADNLILSGGHVAFGLFGNVRLVFTWMLDFAFLYYNWHLYLKGVLR